jgi:cyclopropane fatty-acyl-phospholipid synthase-like methyltransferase
MNKIISKEDIRELLHAIPASAALGTAIQTGLLWLLEDKPLSAQDIVQVLHIHGKRGYYWLQYLEEIGVLEYSSTGYSPSIPVREAILDTYSQESWKHLAFDERERTAVLYNLPQYISEPGSIWVSQGLPAPKDYVEKMRNNPQRARVFTRMLYEVHQALANAVAEFLNLADVHYLMDFGGGSGVISMALLRKYPSLAAVVVDIENVCVAGREIAVEQGLADRISYHPANFSTDEFPTGFDMILQCDVGVFGLPLFQKLFKSLKPGGRLVFVDLFSQTDHSAPVSRVEWTFLDSLDDPNFSFPSIAQAQTQLTEVGFQVLPETHTLGKGLIVLQAIKR